MTVPLPTTQGFPAIPNIAPSLAGVQTLFLDFSPIIYFVEANPLFFAPCRDVFDAIDTSQSVGITSSLTFAEVLALPLRNGDAALAQLYRDFIAALPFATIAITDAVAERATDLRARYSLKTPDALQLAAAPSSGCDGFLTGDARLQSVREPVLQVFVVQATPPAPISSP